ncbi:hypothetical protein BJX70DRAFT_79600 [Aspergillus crustosus]
MQPSSPAPPIRARSSTQRPSTRFRISAVALWRMLEYQTLGNGRVESMRRPAFVGGVLPGGCIWGVETGVLSRDEEWNSRVEVVE